MEKSNSVTLLTLLTMVHCHFLVVRSALFVHKIFSKKCLLKRKVWEINIETNQSEPEDEKELLNPTTDESS